MFRNEITINIIVTRKSRVSLGEKLIDYANTKSRERKLVGFHKEAKGVNRKSVS